MIGCVIAMDREADLLSQMKVKHIASRYGKPVRVGSAFGTDVALVTCGVGKVNAAAGACAALEAGADVLLNFGAAGGLNPQTTEVGEVYLIDRAVQYDFDCAQLNGLPVGTLDGETEPFLPLFCPPLPYPRRALGTGDRFNDSPADHALLLSLGCDVREMEGGAIAQVCKYAGVPFCSVKAISDVYGLGSTTGQFRENCARALRALGARLPEIFAALGGAV